MTQMFGILAGPIGFIMELLYRVIPDYGLTIIVLTVLLRLIMFPLTIKQQKSQARMSAYQPMIQEIQNKWKNDKQKQQEEVMKFQEENGMKMTAGCLPMIVNMLVLFGIIAVIQAPMQYVLNVSTDEIAYGKAIVQTLDPSQDLQKAGYTAESILIGELKTNPDWFREGAEVNADLIKGTAAVANASSTSQSEAASSNSNSEKEKAAGNTVFVKLSEETIEKVNHFNFRFIGLNLAQKPEASNIVSLIFPILSILTMFLSQFIVMKTSGQSQGNKSMLIMTVVMGAMFGYFAFTIPAGFSLYYTVSNVVMTIQQLVVKKIYDPEKIKEEVMAEIEERKKQKKAKKKVTITDDSGEKITKEVSDAELAKLRLAKARELDALQYADTEEDIKKAEEMSEKAREIDAAKYEGSTKEVLTKTEEDVENKDEAEEGEEEVAAEQEPAAEYKPGRRKRARSKKEEKSTLSKEMQDEPLEEDEK